MRKVLLIIIILLTCGCNEKKEYLVSFDSAGGSIVMDVLVENNEFIIEPPKPEKDDYVFVGWYQDDELYDFSIPVTNDVSLKAHWLKKETCNLTCGIGYRIDNPYRKNCTCIKNDIPVATEILLDNESIIIEVGKKEKITATIIPNDVPFIDIKWSSSNSNIASVDNGVVKGINYGTATIIATFGEAKSSLNVVVVNPDLVGDYLKKFELLLNKALKELNNNSGFGNISKNNNNIDIVILDKISVTLNSPFICNDYINEYLSIIDKNTKIEYAIIFADKTSIEGSNKELGIGNLIKTLRELIKHFKGNNNKIKLKITISLNKEKVTRDYNITIKSQK